jgi:hypothetical protein
MFIEMDRQNMADRIKSFVLDMRVPQWSKNVALRGINEFESLLDTVGI